MNSTTRLGHSLGTVLLLTASLSTWAGVAVNLTAPADSSTHAPGGNTTLSATTSVSGGYTVSKVEFFHGSTLIGTDTNSPYSIVWNNVPQGNYLLTAKATAIKAGSPNQTATSSPRNIRVTVTPVVSLTSPTSGARLNGPGITLSATASDSDGSIASVQFFWNGVDDFGSATLTAPPYTVPVSLNPTFSQPTESGDDHMYTIHAIATDNQGATAMSAFSVIGLGPGIALTSPAANATFVAPATIPLQAVLNPNYPTAFVEFYHGTTLIGAQSNPPYTLNWQNVSPGNYSVTAKVTSFASSVWISLPINITVNPPAPPETLHFVHVDHLNTPRLVANAAGQTVWRWDQQEAFGSNPADENPSGLGVFDLPLRLPGQYFDKETNLHYNYFRDFDPVLGRYEESDPIGLRGGLNTYVYVRGNPLVRRDSRGLNPDDPPRRECKPSPCMKNCLDKVVRADTSDVVVVSDERIAFPRAITDVNSITTNETCSGFFSDHLLVLEEYWHTAQQWNTGQLTALGYAAANKNGYWKNPWEVQAKNFAINNLEEFRKCLACCK